jgi:hypothetical protein
MEVQQFQRIWQNITETPGSWIRYAKRHGLGAASFDILVEECFPEQYKELIAQAERYIVKYGLYHNNLSNVSVKVLAKASQIPVTVAALASQKVGTAAEILTACRVRGVVYSDTIFSLPHLLKEYKLNEQKLVDALDADPFNTTKVLDKASKRFRTQYEKMLKVQQEAYRKSKITNQQESKMDDPEVDPDLEIV